MIPLGTLGNFSEAAISRFTLIYTSPYEKSEKNSIIKDIKNKVSEDLDNQVAYIEKINDYNEKWQECFDNKDLSGMKKATKNIQKYLSKTLPLEDVLQNARKIEIMQNLVESTGSFDITDEEKELAGVLSY